MIINTTPAPWNSVHRPIEYVYDHEQQFISGVTVDGGLLQVSVPSSWIVTPVVGDKMAIIGVLDLSVSIAGTYEITAIAGTQYTLDISVTTPTLSAPSKMYFVRLPTIELIAGYLSGEEYPTDLPEQVVATFTPENSPDNDVRFDVSEYLKSIFEIVAPVEGLDFNMFNRFRLKFDGTYKDYYQVLNSSILTSVLNSNFVDTNAPLNSANPPIVFECGQTILSYLTGSVVINNEFENADIPVGDYSPDDYAGADYFLST